MNPLLIELLRSRTHEPAGIAAVRLALPANRPQAIGLRDPAHPRPRAENARARESKRPATEPVAGLSSAEQVFW